MGQSQNNKIRAQRPRLGNEAAMPETIQVRRQRLFRIGAIHVSLYRHRRLPSAGNNNYKGRLVVMQFAYDQFPTVQVGND